MQKRKLARGVAVVGTGMSKFGMFKDKNSKDLFAEAFNEMRSSVDKGLDPNDIEALYLGNFTNDFFVHQGHWGPIISDLIGHAPKPATRTEGACASGALAFREGVFAIASGFYDMVLVGGVEEMSKRTTEEVTEGLSMASVTYEKEVGFTFPGVFGALATAYFDKYGATREHLMNVTIKSHNNAQLNPKAQFNISIRGIMNSRTERAKQRGEPIPTWRDEKEFLRDIRVNPVVAWPMHLYDCS
ncbi:beta-ketoacyl synthase N-terminal-like domain-containing protein, partial [Chloroflexota bacterium]